MRNIVLNIQTTCIEKGDVVVLLGCACAWCSIIGIRYFGTHYIIDPLCEM